MSKWTHQLCSGCYHARQPGRAPHRLIGEPAGRCCACGLGAADIPYRDNPKGYKYCEYIHPEDRDDAH